MENEKEYTIILTGSDIFDLVNIASVIKPEEKSEILKKIEAQINEQK